MANPYNNTTLTRTRRSRYYEYPPDWESITSDHRYQDGGKTFNENGDVAPQKWELVYSGLLVQGDINEAIIFDEHFAEKHLSTPFLFIDKFGTPHAVYYESFERSHDAHKSWIQERRVTLISLPGADTSILPAEPPEMFSFEATGEMEFVAEWSAAFGADTYEIEITLED